MLLQVGSPKKEILLDVAGVGGGAKQLRAHDDVVLDKAWMFWATLRWLIL